MIRRQADIEEKQFVFTSECETAKVIFILRQLQEKYLTKKMPFAYVDLQKAFYRVPRDAVWWALRKLGVKEWLLRAVQSTYKNVQSRVRANGTLIDDFLVQVVLHQDSV